MPPDPDAPAHAPSAPRSRARPAIALSIAIGLLCGLLCIVALGWSLLSQNFGRTLLGRTFSALTGRTLTIDVSQPTVVDRIQRLQRLETVVYTMDKIVTGAKESSLLPDFLAGDRLLMMVHGEVVAGIDFSNLKTQDVRIDGKQLHLHLPDAQVFSTRLDSAKTRVYSRQTGLLVPTDPNLETEVRKEAERELQQAALADGILKTAQQNAAATLTSLLQGLGFESIDFD